MLQKIIFSITGYLVIDLIILVHEAGHFLAARATGTDIDVISFGIGKAIYSRMSGNGMTEIRIGLLPLGGYCRISGERDLKKALKSNEWERINPGSIYHLKPISRILIYLSGSLLNLVFSFLLLLMFFMLPYLDNNQEAKIVQMDSANETSDTSFHTGDVILAINEQSVGNFFNAYEMLLENSADTSGIRAKISRGGRTIEKRITPTPNENGDMSYGITKYEDPIIGRVENFSVEYDAGLRKGDIILEANGKTISNSYDFLEAIEDLKEHDRLKLTIKRSDGAYLVEYAPRFENGKPILNFAFRNAMKTQNGMSLGNSITNAGRDAFGFVCATAQGIASVFSNIRNLKYTFSGPARASQAVGQIADVGFSVSFSSAIRAILYIASMISASLCFINLLPLPALDGGGIVVGFVEIAAGNRLLKPKTYKKINTTSQIFTILLLVIIWISDTVMTYNLKL